VVRKEDLEFGERRKLLEEIELLKELDHPNIGQVIEMYEDPKKIYFVNEMMQGGSLLERLTQEFMSESTAANIIHQILSAVTYLHSKGYVHGDIKPLNLHF
jgi:calcium-dependent protein kinase